MCTVFIKTIQEVKLELIDIHITYSNSRKTGAIQN